jgi:Domain of unknown function (DUF6438)
MKIITFLVTLLVITSCENKTGFIKTPTIRSAVDDLKSESEVEKFIQKSGADYQNYKLKNIQDFNRRIGHDSLNKILAHKLNVNTKYTKADFDNNRYTDLLAIGDDNNCTTFRAGTEIVESCSFSPIVLMNYGKRRAKIFRINLEWEESLVPKVEYINSQPFLVVYQQKFDWLKKTYSESKTILTFKFGDFIEYNKKPKKNKIAKIEFSTSGCFGTCPEYELTLQRDSLSIFNAQHYNFTKDFNHGTEEGVFTTSKNKMEFDKLEEIINYCDFENLKKQYSVTHTDDQTGFLKITYKDGKVKTISDYGMIGTYGLKILYKKLAELRFNQKWH